MSLITVSAFTIPADNLPDGTNYSLRLWYNIGFLDSSGQAVQSGTATTGTQFRFDAVVAGGQITFDPLSVYSTLDALVPTPQSILISCQVFRGNSGLPIYPFNQIGTPSQWIVPDDLGSSINFEEWTIANQRIVLANPPQTFYTAAEVDALIHAVTYQPASTTQLGIVTVSSTPTNPLIPIAVEKTDYATTTNNGVVRLSNTPTVAAQPTAYSITDTHQPLTTTPIYYASQFASVNAAITAIGSAVATLIVSAAQAPITTVTIPATLTLAFEGAGSLLLTTGQTITILSDTSNWPVRKIFFNAAAGQGTVSFNGTTLLWPLYPQWWGATTVDGLTAWNACIAAAATAGGGLIKAIVGTYIQSAIVSFAGRSAITIEGAGEATIFDNSGHNFRVFDGQNSSKITIRNVKFKGDFDQLLPNQAGQGAIVTDNASSSNFAKDIVLENCYFENLRGDAVRFGPNTQGAKIINPIMRGGLGFLELSGVQVLGDSRPVSNVIVDNPQLYGTLSGGRNDGGPITGSDDFIDCFGGTENVQIRGGFMAIPGATSATTSTNATGVLLNPNLAGQGMVRNFSVIGTQFAGFNSTAAAVPSQAAIGLESHETDCFENILIDSIEADNCHFGISVADGVSKGIKLSNYTVSRCLRGVNLSNSDDVDDSSGLILYPTDIGMYLQGDRTRSSNLRVFLDSTLVGANKAGIYVTTGDNQELVTPHIYGTAASAKSITIVAGAGTQLVSPEIIGQAGTAALNISVDATDVLVTNPAFVSNTTNYANASLTTIVRGMSAAGTPEGVIAAAVSSTYLRTNGGAGTTFYVKESGTGNTGWVGYNGGVFAALSAASITDSGLTAGRVTFAGVGGLLSDDADLTFSGATLTATNIVSSGGALNGTLGAGTPAAVTGTTVTGNTALVVAATGKLRTAPKTNNTWGAAISLDVSISNHDITAVFATSATCTITPAGAGSAGDWIFINTINGAGGSVVVTFASTFHSSGTQTTQASRFSSITFRSTGSIWVEQFRTTDLA